MSVKLYSTFYFIFFFHVVTFGFSCGCYLLNALRHNPNHSATINNVSVTINIADIRTLQINFLTPVFAKPVFSAGLYDFN